MNIKRYELKPEQLRWQCKPEILKFKSTEDLALCEGIIGQPRAIDALKLGLNVKYPGYNIFVTGPVGTGRTTAITKLLEELKAKKEKLKDLLYVNNFKNPDMPKLIVLEAGKGKQFKEAMARLIYQLKSNIPQIFSSEEYQNRRQQIVNKYEKEQQKMINEFEKKVEEKGFKLVQVQMGPFLRPAILPIIEDKPRNFEELDELIKEKKLTPEQLEKIKQDLQELEKEMSQIYAKTKENQEKLNEEIAALNEWIVKPMVNHLIDEIRKKFDDKKVNEYLDEVLAEIITNIERFIKKENKQDELRVFEVNLLVDNSETKGVPIIFETAPNFKNLFGTIERYSPAPGVFTSDFMNIKAGSFLRANGGYLVLNAYDVLIEPGVWQTLKRALRNGMVDIQVFDPFYLFSTSALKPEPISVDVKVVMIGSEWLYYLLYYNDEDVKTIFKVRADFDIEMEKNIKNIYSYASFIKSICNSENLLPFSKEAVAEIIEYGVRLAGRKDKITTRFHIIADTIREADYWARQRKAKEVNAIDVVKAIEGWQKRMNMYEEKIQEMIKKDILMIQTKGAVVGQVNGLSVYQLGDYTFGRPTKITAKTSVGRAGIINIEREANLAGRTFNKGVLIISGFLRSRYAQERPLSMDATLGFEQSYSEIDGDSASSAEIYAILSALSNVPIKQGIAVTGSVNQNGEIQPIGGVNEKIEGFFEVCKAKGLTGDQGVIIPKANINNLMLKQEVIDAVKNRKFHIYAIKNIDEGIEILTGKKAGKRTKYGFEKNSINYLVEKRLREYAEKLKGEEKEEKNKNNKRGG
uniref:endopeptidase La n=1 Tax=candidate division WOR-3 bacterium TaxID=2052148 RepID=A0A7V3VUA6_UNCW3